MGLNEIFLQIESFFILPWVATPSKLVLIILIGFICFKIMKHFVAYCQKIDIDTTIIRLVERFLKAIIILIMIAAGLSALGINFEGAWAFLTSFLALIAIGFIAVWSVLSNFVCALLILILKPFKLGDEIILLGEDISGKVIDLSPVYTKLVQEDGKTYCCVPNNFFFQKAIVLRPTNKPKSTSLRLLDKIKP